MSGQIAAFVATRWIVEAKGYLAPTIIEAPTPTIARLEAWRMLHRSGHTVTFAQIRVLEDWS